MRHPQATLAIVLSTLLLSCFAWNQSRAAEKSVKIGVLTDMNGPYAAITGSGSVAAARLAIEDAGGTVLGRRIELVVGDHLQKADVGATIARTWYDTDGVDAIFDGAGSSVALAIIEIARAKGKIAAFSGVISPDVTGKLCGETISSWAWDTHSMVATTMRSVMKSGAKTVFFITLDAAAGKALEADATKIIMEEGGKVIGSVKHPINNPDFSSFLLQAQTAKPDAIVLANAGADTVNSLKQAGEFGLTSGPNPIRLVNLLAMINDIRALGPEVAKGVVVAESFYWDANDETRAWNKRFEKLTGASANMLQAAVYSSALHYLKSVARVGSTDSIAVAKEMKRTPVNDMYSRNVMLREDGRAVRDFYMFQVKGKMESNGPWDLYQLVATLPGPEAFPTKGSQCPLLKQ